MYFLIRLPKAVMIGVCTPREIVWIIANLIPVAVARTAQPILRRTPVARARDAL